MPSETTSPELLRYKAVLLAILDFQIDRLGGQFVCDGYDGTSEYFVKQKAQMMRLFRRKQLALLQKQLTRMIKLLRPDLMDIIAEYVQDRAGYTLEQFSEWQHRLEIVRPAAHRFLSTKGHTERSEILQPGGVRRVHIRVSTGPRPDYLDEKEAVSPDGRFKVRVVRWRKWYNASTSVTLILPTAAGPIFGVAGIRMDVRADWTDNGTILIEANEIDKAYLCCNEVRSIGEVIRVKYKVIDPGTSNPAITSFD